MGLRVLHSSEPDGPRVRTGYLHSSYSKICSKYLTHIIAMFSMQHWIAGSGLETRLAITYSSSQFSFLSVETEAKGTPGILDFAEVCWRIQTTLVDFVPPAHAGTLCFWGEESTYDHVVVGSSEGQLLGCVGWEYQLVSVQGSSGECSSGCHEGCSGLLINTRLDDGFQLRP